MRVHHAASSTARLKLTLVKTPNIGIPIHPEGVLGCIAEIYCPLGAHVNKDEVMAIVDTDKLAVDVKAPHGGIVRKIHVSVDDEVRMGDAVFSLEQVSEVASHASDDDAWRLERQWAWDLRQRKLRDARENERHWRAWQVKWQEEQRKRWEDWQKRSGRAWWRQQQARWRQQQSSRHRRRDESPSSLPVHPSSQVNKLPQGAVREMLLARNHYEALGVTRTCTSTEVKSAFRALALRLHPDTAEDASATANGGMARGEYESAMHEAFTRLQEAHSTLSNVRRRKDYDRELGW